MSTLFSFHAVSIEYIEESKKAVSLTKDRIIEFIIMALRKSPQAMINILVNKIILYDDQIEIYYNYSNTKDPDDNDNRRDFLFCNTFGSLPFSRTSNSGVELRNILVELYI